MSVALLAAPGAEAQTTIVLWDQGIAAEINRQLVGDETCRTSPYDLFRRGCASNQLDDGLGRRVTTLDQLALLVYRYKNVNLKKKLRPGTELKFTTDLMTLYKRKAEVWLTLKARF